MKNLIIFSLLLCISLIGYNNYTQGIFIDEMIQANRELAGNIQVANTKQLQVNRVSREIQDRSRASEPWANYLAKIYIRAGKRYDVNPMLLVRIGSAESKFRVNAVSSAGAIGLQQIMPKYWAKGEISYVKSAKDLFDPEINIHASAHIISYYIRTGGSTAAGVRMYHGGFKAIKTPRAITVQYERDVLRGYEGYQV